MPHQRAVAELEIADIYAELNLSDEAFEIYEKVSETLKKLKLRGEEARARANFGRVASVLEKVNLARKELKKSARLYELEKNPNGVAAVKLTQANLEISQAKYENALQIIKETEKVLSKSENLRQKLLLEFLKAETLRKLGMLRLPVDLAAVVREVAETEAIRAGTDDVTLRAAPYDGALVVSGDPELLFRLCANLVNNAVKYSRPGGVVDLSLAGRRPDRLHLHRPRARDLRA